jgi:hypothetical protein
MHNNGESIRIEGLIVRVNKAKRDFKSGFCHVVDASVLAKRTEAISSGEAADLLFSRRRETIRNRGIGVFVAGAFPLVIGSGVALEGYSKDPVELRVGFALITIAILLMAGGFLSTQFARKLTKERFSLAGGASAQQLARLRTEVRKRMATKDSCIGGWPAEFTIDDVYTGENSYHVADHRCCLVGPEEFENNKWVLDPSDSSRYYRKEYDRNNPKMPFFAS